jgi:cell division protein FtsN
MNEEKQSKEPMSGKKLFAIVAAVMIGAVIAGLVLFTNFL